MGEEEEEEKKCDSQSLNGEVTTGVEMCRPDYSGDKRSAECSVSTLYHAFFFFFFG